MKKILNKTMLLLTLTLSLLLSVTSVTVFAASSNPPYGYTFSNSAYNRVEYKFYQYNNGSYHLAGEIYAKNVSNRYYLYRNTGIELANDLKGVEAKFSGFGTDGNFYYINTSNKLVKVESTNRMREIAVNVIRLNYNSDDLAVSATSQTGTFYLSNLSPAPVVDDGSDVQPVNPPAAVPANRVDISTNSVGETYYDAYSNKSLKTRIIVSKNGKSVLNATAKVRLSDSLKGAKFIGFDTKYNVYLSEGSTLYRFENGKWYSAQKMKLSGTYKSFQRNEAGFITKVVTTSGYYTMNQLVTGNYWIATSTYAVTKGNYTTMYVKGSTKSYTLILTSGKLSYNGKVVAKNVKKFGFVNSKKFTFIKSDGKVYTTALSKPTKAKKIYTGGKSYKTKNGLVSKVVTKKGNKPIK